jgi:hypothetical protein
MTLRRKASTYLRCPCLLPKPHRTLDRDTRVRCPGDDAGLKPPLELRLRHAAVIGKVLVVCEM